MKAIDLFCGCGGISAGLKMSGVDVIAGIDNNKEYSRTFIHNFKSSKYLHIDLSKITPKELGNLLDIGPENLDVLVGGPPCQGFSKNVPRKHRFLSDENNLLIRSFLSNCEYFLPKFILMENVAEMKNSFHQAYTQEILERLQNLGYSVNHKVLNAADYGIPQRRRRAFFIAQRGTNSMPEFPIKTHYQNSKSENFNLFNSSFHVNVWNAIGDLPNLQHDEGENPCQYKCAAFSDYQKKVRNGSNMVFNHVSRPLRDRQFARLNSLLPGQGVRDLPDHLKVKAGYSGAYGRLTKEMVAPTITRWVFHPGSGRWGHPEDIRLITIREAARIQGFLDNFEFVGSYNQQAGQIGNAVPPLLIHLLMNNLLNSGNLDQSHQTKFQ